MILKVVIHGAETASDAGDDPALPRSATQGEATDELCANVHETVAGWLNLPSNKSKMVK